MTDTPKFSDGREVMLYAIGLADHAWEHEASWLDLNRPGTRNEIGAALATLVTLSDARANAHAAWCLSMQKERYGVRG